MASLDTCAPRGEKSVVVKRRAGKAPEGSGVPVGTEYHWYILAHQNVRKLNANDYTTSMTGLKYKLAHRRADGEKWSASDRARRNRLIKLLKQMVQDLEQQVTEKPGRAAEKKSGAEINRHGPKHNGRLRRKLVGSLGNGKAAQRVH